MSDGPLCASGLRREWSPGAKETLIKETKFLVFPQLALPSQTREMSGTKFLVIQIALHFTPVTQWKHIPICSCFYCECPLFLLQKLGL